MRCGLNARLVASGRALGWIEDKPDAVPTYPARWAHRLFDVYSEMLIQICRDYPGLPDPRTLTLTEIRFFYDGLRESLKRATQPRPQVKLKSR